MRDSRGIRIYSSLICTSQTRILNYSYRESFLYAYKVNYSLLIPNFMTMQFSNYLRDNKYLAEANSKFDSQFNIE